MKTSCAEFCINPKGIASSSPGLLGTSYPGWAFQKNNQPQRGCVSKVELNLSDFGRNRVAVVLNNQCSPRVARSSQPWALSRNPVGILRQNIFRKCAAALSLLLILVCTHGQALAGNTTKLALPFEENFSSTNLDSAWTQEISSDGKIFIKDNWITFESHLLQRCHIDRSPGIDNITISAKIVRWSGIYLVWDENNWCGVSKVYPTPFGRIYTINVINGKTNEVNHRGVDFNSPQNLRVQLGGDHVRFQWQLGKDWLELRTIERPKGFSGAPKLIRVGKYYGEEDTPYNVVGDEVKTIKVSGAIRELRVEATPKNKSKLTKAEIAAIRNPQPEPAAALLQKTNDDPTFEKLENIYPPFRYPREIVGVPAHPLDIGVDRLGRLDVSPWSAAPLVWFKVGDSPKPFGEEGVPFTRRLLHGYLPVLTLSRVIDDVDYQMTVFGTSENFRVDKDLFAYVRFIAKPSGNTSMPRQMLMRWAKGTNTFHFTQVAGYAQALFKFKYPEPETVVEITPEEFQTKSTEAVTFWKKRLEPAELFQIPDARVSEAYRAWLVYSMLNADTINGFIEPHDGAGFYEEMFGYSVAVQTMALDHYGFHDYAAQILDTQIHYQNADGLYTQACGLSDPGTFLAALARHFQITGDREWFRRIAPNIIKQCEWLMRQRDATLKDGMMRGLIKFRPYNDFQYPVFNYLGNAWCAQGMKLAATALKENKFAEGDKFSTAAQQYRKDILDSMEAAAVVRDGQTLLPMEPDTHRLLKMSRYRGGDYYGLVASSLLETDFLAPDDKRATWIVDALEKRGGLIAGVSEFDGGIDHAYTYGYLMNRLKRGEVRKTLLGFWSFLAFAMTRDTYSPVEVHMIDTGENQYTLPHLYSCTEQLRLLRNLLLREDGNTLVIGDGVPRAWLEANKHVSAKGAPTEFGTVSFEINPLSDGTTRVSFEPPSRRSPEKIFIRLRDAKMRTITSVTSLPKCDVLISNETIVLPNLKTPVDLHVRFGAN